MVHELNTGLCQVVGAIGVLVAATVAAPTPVDSANFRPIIILWLAFSLAADTMITVILCHHLVSHPRDNLGQPLREAHTACH